MNTQMELLKNDLNNERQIAEFLKDVPARKTEYRQCLMKIKRLQGKLKNYH